MEGDVLCKLLKMDRDIVISLVTYTELSSDFLSRVYNLIYYHCKEIEMLCFGFFSVLFIDSAKKMPNYWKIIEISIFKAAC